MVHEQNVLVNIILINIVTCITIIRVDIYENIPKL